MVKLIAMQTTIAMIKFYASYKIVPVVIYPYGDTKFVTGKEAEDLLRELLRLANSAELFVISKDLYTKSFTTDYIDDNSKLLSIPFEEIFIECDEKDIIDVGLYDKDLNILSSGLSAVCLFTSEAIIKNFTTFILPCYDHDFEKETYEEFRQLLQQCDGTPESISEELRNMMRKIFTFFFIPYNGKNLPMGRTTMAHQIVGFVKNLFDNKKLKYGVDRVNERYKVKIGNKKELVKIKKYIIIDTQKETYEKSKYTGNHIDWSHAWKVQGHWRKTEGIGKDRAGNYCIDYKTWVTSYTKGKGDVVEKIRWMR